MNPKIGDIWKYEDGTSGCDSHYLLLETQDTLLESKYIHDFSVIHLELGSIERRDTTWLKTFCKKVA